MSLRDRVFISYSRRDRSHLESLRTHLAPIARTTPLDFWDDTRISAGSLWEREIEHALDRSAVGVLLLSPSFLASPFVSELELPRLLWSARGAGLTAVIVHVRPTAAGLIPAPLFSLQAANDPTEPVSALRGANRERAWSRIAETIANAARRATVSEGPSSRASDAFGIISLKIQTYALKAADVKSAFQLLGVSALDYRTDFKEVTSAVNSYNEIFTELTVTKDTYVNNLRRLLPPELSTLVEELFNFALDDIHRTYVFQLNEVRVTMNRLHDEPPPVSEADRLRAKLRSDMDPLLRGLADKIPVLQQKVRHLYDRVSLL